MSRNKIFVDTSAWYAFIDKNDRDHPAAMNKVKVLDRSLITSNYVLDEIVTLLNMGNSRFCKFTEFRTKAEG